jgi:hypothetical protein
MMILAKSYKLKSGIDYISSKNEENNTNFVKSKFKENKNEEFN